LLGRSQQYQGMFSEAVRSYQTSISLNSDFSESYYYLGLVFLKLKNDKNACKNFSIAASLDNSEAKKIEKRYCY
jgi:tetratricopeptide (TPR) repeat protein